jgi:uncharacterized membrane protein
MKIAGHPVHPMLIVFPLGLLATAVIFDIITLSTSDGKWSHHGVVHDCCGNYRRTSGGSLWAD